MGPHEGIFQLLHEEGTFSLGGIFLWRELKPENTRREKREERGGEKGREKVSECCHLCFACR